MHEPQSPEALWTKREVREVRYGDGTVIADDDELDDAAPVDDYSDLPGDIARYLRQVSPQLRRDYLAGRDLPAVDLLQPVYFACLQAS